MYRGDEKVYILSIHNGHDSSVALVKDGCIVSAVQEERFTRVKNDSSFPVKSIKYTLENAGITSLDIDEVVIAFRYMPMDFFKFFRLGHDNQIFRKILQHEARDEKIYRKMFNLLRGDYTYKKNRALYNAQVISVPVYFDTFELRDDCNIVLEGHHVLHAASTFFTSGFNESETLIVTADGKGWDTTIAVWQVKNNIICPIIKYGIDASIGHFYSNATEALGWIHGMDEWKLMGLAPYGTAREEIIHELMKYAPEFNRNLLVKPQNYGNFYSFNDHGTIHFHNEQVHEITKVLQKTSREDFAASVQKIAETEMMQLISYWGNHFKKKYLCCSGGFFMNVKVNQILHEADLFDDVWIYSEAGDSGLAVGGALKNYYSKYPNEKPQRIRSVYWGPEFDNEAIKTILIDRGIECNYFENIEKKTADLLQKNYVVGWFQGRMEAGARALGNRSILMSPIVKENKDLINRKIKYREHFRPFAPSILYEKASEYIENCRDEFFMMSSFRAVEKNKNMIPAVVHVDNTLRAHLVKEDHNRRYYQLLKEFGLSTGVYVLLNTSMNVKGEPIVCSPREAIKCFYDTGMDALVMGNYIITKMGVK